MHVSMHTFTQIPKQTAYRPQRERTGLFLPDALCLKKKVLTDSWAPRPYSARVQCGCLANEVDYRDYNQAGNISALMCQSRGGNLPVLQSRSEVFQLPLCSYLPYIDAEPCHSVSRVALRSLQPVTVNGGWIYGGNSRHYFKFKPPVDTEGTTKCTNYLPLAFMAVKCGSFNLGVFNLEIIIQLGLNGHFFKVRF